MTLEALWFIPMLVAFWLSYRDYRQAEYHRWLRKALDRSR